MLKLKTFLPRVIMFRIVVCSLFLLTTGLTSAQDKLDVVLKNGRVIDGTGAPWFRADVGVRDGKIARIGRIDESEAEKTINASGLIVAPGFVDMMGQTATPLLRDPESAFNLLSQGITTINCGEGQSAAPLSAEDGAREGWTTFAEYFQLLEQQGLPVNVVQTVGHTQVRRQVIGEVDRRPTEDELKKMKQLVARAMEDGAIGLSTALIYPPAVYASTEEIAALAAEAGARGGRYYTHMRNEGDQLLEAIEEALEIGRQAKTPVHIFHLKAAGQQNWGKMDLAIARIKAARASGQQVAADIYPYINNGLGIAAFMHPRNFREGREKLLRTLDDPKVRARIRKEIEEEPGWENWFRHTGNNWDKVVLGSIRAKEYSEYEGLSLGEIARRVDKDPWLVFFEIARHGAFALPQSMTDANKIKLIQQEFVSFCTDVGPAGGSRITSHPRAYGSFPRLLSRYVRDLGAISLERAIAQASAVGCNEVLAHDRGRIAVGQAADVVVFNYDELGDNATFAEPHKASQGIRYVLVNGQLAFENGKLTESKPGRVLRGPGTVNAKTADVDPRLRSFDEMMNSFLDRHRVAGASLAVTENSRLVLAKGYGHADLESREPVTPGSLFRIASISKPITAVAILQLVDQKKLKLDDKVLDTLELAEPTDTRQNLITVRHLLQHTGGWDRSVSFDAMFQSVRFAEALNAKPPAGPQEIIANMLRQKLDTAPGEHYAYSNYGYCLAGRVIEKLTGQTYEAYVKRHVLKPLGITHMRIGRSRRDQRAAGEVRYYTPRIAPSVFAADLGQEGPAPYGGWYHEAMDSHGAWIGSAVDLVRFASAFDDPKKCPILSEEAIHEMVARPPGKPGLNGDGSMKDVHYGLGWFVRTLKDGGRINIWHTGSLPGTATILVRRHDGRNWAVLFNGRESAGSGHLGRAVDSLVHQAADKVTEWPESDLFPKYISR